MKDSGFIRQLEGLKEIKPDRTWREANRSVLLAQINSGQTMSGHVQGFWSKFESAFIIFKALPQPALAVAFILVFFAGSGLSIYAARDSQPGETLYIAKKAGERTQLVLAFSDEKKLKLNLEFAGERAREINRAMETNNDKTEESVARLVSDFKKEISNAKGRAEKIARVKQPASTLSDQTDIGKATGAPDIAATALVEDMPVEIPGEEVFTASLGKDDKGIETSEAAETEATEVTEATEADEPEGQTDALEPLAVDTAAESATTTIQSIVNGLEKNINELLQTQDSIKEEDLEALTQAIEQLSVNQVKGASSTEEVGLVGEVLEEEGILGEDDN